jgi:hypothetical protein
MSGIRVITGTLALAIALLGTVLIMSGPSKAADKCQGGAKGEGVGWSSINLGI